MSITEQGPSNCLAQYAQLLIRRYAPKGPLNCALQKLGSHVDSEAYNGHRFRACNWENKCFEFYTMLKIEMH